MANMSPVEVQKYLSGLDYPAEKDEIVGYAEDQGAEDEILQVLQRLPEKTYNAPAEVSEELGKII
jgi:hypothetical protein